MYEWKVVHCEGSPKVRLKATAVSRQPSSDNFYEHFQQQHKTQKAQKSYNGYGKNVTLVC